MMGKFQKMNQLKYILALLSILVISGTACGRAENPESQTDTEILKVVASTTFIGDVAARIAGEAVELTVLLEPGQNPHSYQPAPMDMVAVTEADLILVNGLGLEEFLDDLLAGSNTSAEVLVVSNGIDALEGELHDLDDEDHDDHEGEDHDDQLEGTMGLDPHVWFDPNSILIWVENITGALVRLDPDQSETYLANAEEYSDQLTELDQWIKEQFDLIPDENRELVTDHTSLGYLARRYDLGQIGAVIPALTTEAETSGMELADLIDKIEEHSARAIFVGVDFDQNLAQRVAEEAGVPLVPLYFGSLSAGKPAGTYLDFMYYNVEAISTALR